MTIDVSVLGSCRNFKASLKRKIMSSTPESPKEIATRLAATAATSGVRFPKVWDEKQILQKCFATLMLFKEDGVFDETAALANLIETYGQIEVTQTGEGGQKRKKADEKQPAETSEGAEVEKVKKPKASETVLNEANRGIAEAMLEIASAYFKNGDRMKGGVYSKGAKAIRECETPIITKKEALALKGVGKGMAAYIEEFHETGSIHKLEELRAGTA